MAEESSILGSTIGCLLGLAHLAMGVVAFFAVIQVVHDWLGIPWIIVVPIVLLFAEVPFIGNALGTYGAIHSWHWPFWGSVAFFWWPLAIIPLILIGGAIIERIEQARIRR